MPGKVLARILLDRVRQKLLTHQRHEQSGFTPNKSTVDRILALRALTEHLRDFRTGLCGSPQGVRLGEPRCNLENPVLRGISPKLVNLISGLVQSAVSCDGTISDYFPVYTGYVRVVFLPQHTSTPTQ